MVKNWNNKFKLGFSLAVVLALVVTIVALADALNGDALVAEPGTQDNINRTVAGGDTVTYDFGELITETGNQNDDVFPLEGSNSLNVTITRTGDWLATSAGAPDEFTFTGYNAQQTGTISILVPCDTEGTIKDMTAVLVAGKSTNGKSLDPQKSSVTLRYRITAGANGSNCASNTAPNPGTISGDSPVDEGSSHSYSSNASDPDSDTLNYTWSVTSGNASIASGQGSSSVTLDFGDGPSTVVLHLVVDDGHGHSVSPADKSISVQNVAPTATFGNNGPVNEGSAATVSFSGQSDPSSADTTAGFHYAFSCTNGDLSGATYAGSGTNTSTTCTYDDGPSTHTVKGRIIDKDGGYTEYTTDVTVNNVAPTIALTGADSVDEGSSYTLGLGAITDPGQDTVTAYSIDWGDGSAPESFSGSPVGLSKTHTYDDGPKDYTITVSLTDEDGTFTGGTKAVHVNNVAPTITKITVSPSPALTGYPVTFTGTAEDPSSADEAKGFTWEWSVDGGPFSGSGNPFTTTFSSCGSHTITAKATDKDGGTSAPFISGVVSVYEAHFLAPLNEGMQNLVQKGRVVPVKISIGCGGVPLTGLSPAIQLLSGDQTAGTETSADNVETLSSSAADTTGIMRPADSMYIYNLQVPSNANTGALFTIRVRPFGTGADMRIVLKIRK